MTSPSFRFVLYVNGILLMILAALMIAPGVVDFSLGNPDWRAFTIAGGTTFFAGSLLFLANAGTLQAGVTQRSSYLLTVTSWLLVGVFGSFPLAISSLHLTFTDAFFETMSGLTTTGSTVLSGLDNMAPGLLLWRSMLQWIGGVGIVVMAIVLLPTLRIGGMQLFHTESSDISDKVAPRTFELAKTTAWVYFALSAACAVSYWVFGMSVFDAINHAMTTLATGGFSTKDASIGYYHSIGIEMTGIVFMTAGALPLVFFARLFTHGRTAFRNEHQVATFIGVLVVAIALAAMWDGFHNGVAWTTALRQAAFNVTSVLTDTGFATGDFSAWGNGAIGLYFMLFLIGGCAGSTAGGIKIFRWQILFRSARRQLMLMLAPHRIIAMNYAGKPVDGAMLASVWNFFFMYLMTLLVLTLACMVTGMDFLSSASSIAQAMANAGPGLGPLVGPATTFEAIPDVAKWIIVAAMLLGRLELATVYTLLIGTFWRD